MSAIPKKHIFIILLIAAVFRIGFLLYGDVLPVMWDARRYVSASLGLISYLDSGGDKPFTTEQEDRYRFKYYNDKYIQGEQIEWLAYQPFTLTEARNELFIGGPLYPAAMSVILWITPANDFTVIRIFNIILDLLALWLLMQIAYRFIGRTGALITGYIYALYFPFIILTSQLLLETSTTLLFLWAIYMLLRGYERSKMKHFILSGLAVGLLVINKPTAMLLFIPVALWFFFYSRKQIQWKQFLTRMLFFATPLLVITVIWGSIATARYGQLALRDPSYSEANLRSSSNIDYEGYDLDKVEADFWTYSISDHITSNPTGYIRLLAKKAERLWSQPANEFSLVYLLPNSWWDFIHKVLVILGIIGLMALLFTNFGNASIILLTAGYYTGIHVIFHSVSRYSVNALPLLFIASAFIITTAIDKLRQSGSNKRNYLIYLIIILFVSIYFDFHWINYVLTIPLTLFIVYTVISIKIIIAALLLFYFYRIVTPELNVTKSVISALVLFLSLGIFYYSVDIARNEWAEFPCKISTPEMKAGTRIYITNPPDVQQNDFLAAVVDLYSGPGRKNTFALRAGGFVNKYIQGQRPLLDYFYPKPTYRFFSHFEQKPLENYRQYAIVMLDPTMVSSLINQYKYFDIEIAINSSITEENNYIVTSGMFPTPWHEKYLPAIRLTTVERYVQKGDPRIRYPVKMYSDSSKSYYIKRNQTELPKDVDLSPLPGKQTGRYNMFLVHFKPNGEYYVY